MVKNSKRLKSNVMHMNACDFDGTFDRKHDQVNLIKKVNVRFYSKKV